MGQLLTLATHCINDVKFYGTQMTPSISINWEHMNQHAISVHLDTNSITPKVKDTYDFEKKVWDLYRKGDNTLAPSGTKLLTINFNDEPPIWIDRFHVVESDKDVIGSLDVVDKKWKLAFLNKTTTHTFKCRLTTHKLEYRITCGTISEVITEEQYNNLIDTYENNKLRLQQEADQAKINQRMKDYE